MTPLPWRGTRALGTAGERAAERHLRRAGYVILARNYRCAVGEVDLVALDGRCVVFVEVKARHDPDPEVALAAVSAAQQRRIARAAQHFLARHRLLGRDVRFDVVGVHLAGGTPLCELIRDAFGHDLW